MQIFPVILCGGSGTRLWPASRNARPKQFLPLISGRSPFQETLTRVVAEGFGRPIVITGSDHRFIAAEQAAQVGIEATIVLEPEARDSGPAFAAGAAFVENLDDGQGLVLALAADHLVRDIEGFRSTVRDAAPAASAGYIVTFGIPPEEPSSAFGYIEAGSGLDVGSGVRDAVRFVEKPSTEDATRYVEAGYLWNSGNFLCRADVFLEEYARRDAETAKAAREAVHKAVEDLDFVRLDATAFACTTKRSVDYAVMEHAPKVAVASARFDWSDIGGWDAMGRVFDTDASGNATNGDVLTVEAHDNVVQTNGPLVVAAGVEGLAIVVTDDAVLVTRRDAGDMMRAVVGKVREHNPHLTMEHVQSFRPWGNYRSLDKGTRHQVKRIVVKPGARLSLQHHHHRAEHWVVVRGTALVTVGGSEQMLRENESVYIPLGSVHRMENPGKIELEMIEVQTGSYLGEDDIVRHEDVYARV